jgi:hypothetical protein
LSVSDSIKDIGCPAENIEMLGQFHNDVIHPTAGCLAVAKKTS